MAAGINDRFNKVLTGTTRPVATTLSAQKLVGATSATVQATTGWETSTAVHGIMYRTDASNTKVPGSQIDWKGVVSGTTISNFTVTAGTDDTYEVGATVELAPTAAWGDDMATGLVVEHNQDGTHGAITTTSINNAGVLTQTGASTFAGAVTLKSYDGWISPSDTWAYASSTTFTISGVDRTAQFPIGTKIKLTQTTAKYFYVTAVAFSTNTTVTVTGGSDYSLANAAITSPQLSYDVTPQGFPGSFNFTPSWSNVTVGSGTNTGNFTMRGKNITVKGSFTYGSGSAVGTTPTLTLPVTSASTSYVASGSAIGIANAVDSGTTNYLLVPMWLTTTTVTFLAQVANATYTSTASITSTVPMTWTTNDQINYTLVYEAA